MSEKLDADWVINNIDAEGISQLDRDLIGIPSPTGHERELGEFILDWFRSNGIETIKQEVGPDRLNAVGIIRGSGGGLSLMFNGHMDTTFTGIPNEQLIMGATETIWRPKAVIKEGVIMGPGAYNDKGPIAAFMVAAKAITGAKIRLKGDLILAAVSGEIERAPIGPYQGPAYWGAGHGTAFLLSHGITSDYALVAEPSGFGITWVLPGVLFAKITVYGEGIYTPYAPHADKFENSPNAIVKMIRIAEAVELWATEYEKINRREYDGRVMIPKVNLGGITGGLPFQPNYSASECSLYIDIRTPPDKDTLEVKSELERVIKGVGIEAQVTLFFSRKGYQGKGNTVLVESLTQSFQQVFGRKPEVTQPPYNSTWNDLNIYHANGIPGVKFGPPRHRQAWDVARIEELVDSSKIIKKEEMELDLQAVKIDDLVNLSKVYALTAADICTRTKP